MLVVRLLGGRRAGRPKILLIKRCIKTQSEIRGDGVLPLDAIVSRLAPKPALSWSASPKRKDSQTLAREIRAFLAANDATAALDLLRNVPQPYPRLVVHAAVHALLRVGQVPRAGALLLSFVTERTSTAAKPPRIHPITLEKSMTALLALVPPTQGRQDRARTPQRPTVLLLDSHMVSDSALRTALALHIHARKLFVPRQREVVARLAHALLNQREWVPAALLFEGQVRDYQLRRTLPVLLRNGNPGGELMTPHDRDHLRRRLALLRLEDMRPSHSLFSDLCYRLAGVISSLAMSHDSGFGLTKRAHVPFPPPKTPPSEQRARHHTRIALQALAILGALVDARNIPFPDIHAWVGAVGSLPATLSLFPAYALIDGRPKRVYAREHLRGVLERYAASVPKTPHLFSFGTSTVVMRRGARDIESDSAHDPTLRTADAPPEALTGYLGPVELDGLSHREREKKRVVEMREVRKVEAPTDPTSKSKHRQSPASTDLDDSLMPPPLIPTYQALLAVFLNSAPAPGRTHGPGSIYEEESAAPGTEAVNDEQQKRARLNEAAERVETAFDDAENDSKPQEEFEERAQRHYHAPRSPNNPDPQHLRYPAHPLDFEKYPDLDLVRIPHSSLPYSSSSASTTSAYDERIKAAQLKDAQAHLKAMKKLGPGPVALRRVQLTADVLRHMMYERSPPMPPWESDTIMRLLGRRADLLRPLLSQSAEGAADWEKTIRRGEVGAEMEVVGEGPGLWDAIWDGAARARREAEVNAAEAMRIDAETEYEASYGWDVAERTRLYTEQKEEWAVDRESGVLRAEKDGKGGDEPGDEELQVFNRKLGARTWDKELEIYYSEGGLST